MTIRESGIATIIGWVFAVWALGFGTNTVLIADRVTSPQWRSLMTVPGGKWFWFGLFAAAGITLICGILTTRYRLRAAGFTLTAAGCFAIAAFYVVAPIFHLGPITLGYWPWFLGIGIGTLGAIVNLKAIAWF